ncbi:putative calcium ATPase [Phakopsora pachyrhizi]|uniref:Calcium ATPase n=1 Tax=Phakopsora pachyrhizi TaxID=170000 RepID=A0AAV0AV75_PHAPC|nr:putative calcium ATPase [Phakopsora pachyrhizi]
MSTRTYVNIVEPTEAVLKVLAEKLQTSDRAFNSNVTQLSSEPRANAVNDYLESKYQRKVVFEFSCNQKSMSILFEDKLTKQSHLFIKGAPETVLAQCTFLQNSRGVPLESKTFQALELKVKEYAQQGLRVLALAVINDVQGDAAHYKTQSSADYIKFEHNMTLVGLVGMLDPPRPKVKGVIAKCRSSGKKVIVITGDNKATAETICQQIGVFGPSNDLSDQSYTGREFDALSESEKKEAILSAGLFLRVEPSQKQKIADFLQSTGLIVAMTGDGVNNAPALKKASIGIAMGSGTDVAKLAPDMALADDNFATIIEAVEEWPSIYENTKQFIRYLISSNITSGDK